jgi:hypothetical protein
MVAAVSPEEEGSPIKRAAKHVGKSTRTIKAWKAEGLDVTDLDAVKRWSDLRDMNSRGFARNEVLRRLGTPDQQQIRDIAEADTLDVKKAVASIEALDPASEGAAAGLKRMQAFERDLAIRFQAAQATGDPLLITAARQDYVAVFESLRRMELAVDKEARDAGQLIQIGEAQEAVRILGEYIKLGFNAWLSSDTPQLVELSNPHKFVTIARKGFSDSMLRALDLSSKTGYALPEWAFQIVESILKPQTDSITFRTGPPQTPEEWRALRDEYIASETDPARRESMRREFAEHDAKQKEQL